MIRYYVIRQYNVSISIVGCTEYVRIQYMLQESEGYSPVVSSVLRAFDAFAVDAVDFTPVTGFQTPCSVAEARSFSLAGVVTTPVKQDGAQTECAVGVVFVFGAVFDHLTLLPQQQIVSNEVHASTDVGGLSFNALELLGVHTNNPKIARHQSSQVGIAELHGQMIWEVLGTEEDRRHRPTAFVSEQRDAIGHANQALIAGFSVHDRVSSHLQHMVSC